MNFSAARYAFLALGLSLSVHLPADQGVQIRSDHEAMARKLFADVIAMDTSVIGLETPKMAAYLGERFRQAGFDAADVMEVPTGPNLMSLMVRYPGQDRNARGIGFLAHLDVVTALRKDWELDPFALTERNGFFIGRGTADNKAGVIGLTAAFIKLKKEGYIPSRDLVLLLTADEESGMVSAKHFATVLKEDVNIEYGINADALSGILAPNGSVFGYYVQGAEKSYRSVLLTVRNPGGHSSAPRPDNAIYQLARALIKVEQHKFPVMINDISAGMMRSAAARSDTQTADAIADLIDDPSNVAAEKIVSRNPLLATVIRTTCVATMLEAGHAENALPQSASATVNCRIMPGVDPASVYSALAMAIDDEGVELQPIQKESTIAPASPMREDIMAAISESIEEYADVELVPFMASYGTDGKEFRSVGIPVYGSSGTFMDPREAYAHGLNERLPVKTFYASLGYWERLIKQLANR
ncbi:MAG: M20/M25/M40 family metallo-hydrolase [Gammaproteobacteria bacterium]|jgi:carboxypeptidase PM20D1|nr:M20/M25/M40 family metallo-hydrolase [Gammaproteobacteria bacterium]MBT4493852.1 M20/M25/M40 family metallo-hydrolase [Gammaproteobacteria bacterium]MBT7371357.1 M20/M25/M40 family metallo-hydrolase [Gammaproteobacteria bacterium]